MAPAPYAMVMARDVVVPHPPTAPYNTPSLTANLVCRVVLAALANISCWVPLKHLSRRGEFAAMVLVGTVVVLNTLTIVNALIWRDDNVDEWWRGQGWCDVHPYINQPLLLVFATSVVAVMRNLAQQVALLRAGPLTARERRRKTLVQSLIIFPLPAMRMCWLYPLAAQRYVIGTLVGCVWTSHRTWPFLVFFVLPIPLLALIAGYYSILTWKRYLQIERLTRSAILSNTSATARADHTRRRLFTMTLCILVPYIPIVCIHSALQLKNMLPLDDAFSFNKNTNNNKIRPGGGGSTWPWNTIVLDPHDQLTFSELNSNYLAILAAMPIFIFFGATGDTSEIYTRYVVVAMRLDKLFPSLRPNSTSSSDSAGQVSAKSWCSRSKTLTPAAISANDVDLYRSGVQESQQPVGSRGSTYSSPQPELPSPPSPHPTASSSSSSSDTIGPAEQRPPKTSMPHVTNTDYTQRAVKIPEPCVTTTTTSRSPSSSASDCPRLGTSLSDVPGDEVQPRAQLFPANPSRKPLDHVQNTARAGAVIAPGVPRYSQ